MPRPSEKPRKEPLTEREALRRALVRLVDAHDGDPLAFWNRSREFKLAFKVTLCDDDLPDADPAKWELEASVCVVAEEHVQAALDMQPGWEPDEDDEKLCVVTTLGVEMSNDGDIDELARAQQVAYDMELCPCSEYFVMDGHAYCAFCELRAREADLERAECAICKESALLLHLPPAPCCGARAFHSRCLNTWKATNPICPLCRAPGV